MLRPMGGKEQVAATVLMGGLSTIVAGIAIIALDQQAVDHRWGYGLVVLGILTIFSGAVIWGSRSPGDDRSKTTTRADHNSTALAAGRDMKIGTFNAAPASADVPAIRVTPIVERGYRYLAVENIGGTADFQAQLEIVENQEVWLGLESYRPPMPYSGYWEENSTQAVRLFQGQIARLAVMGLLPQGGEKDPHHIPQFAYFDSRAHYGRFFGNRIESLDEIENRPPLIVKVSIGSLPSMARPFVGTYRYVRARPLEQIS